MKNKEKLEAVINKAKENGWVQLKEYPNVSVYNLAYDISIHEGQERKLLFQHEFAKAFWGERYANCDKCGAFNEKDCECIDAGLIDTWKYQLQQAVISEDPLGYYYNNIT